MMAGLEGSSPLSFRHSMTFTLGSRGSSRRNIKSCNKDLFITSDKSVIEGDGLKDRRVVDGIFCELVDSQFVTLILLHL